MRILLTNDDGIHAPGLRTLTNHVADLGEITVAAPMGECSAAGHSITLSSPTRVQTVYADGRAYGYSVDGTPSDSVKLALFELLPEPPDLILSGINLGANVGISILYSGTVAGASEGTMLGIPSIAFSLDTYENPRWDAAGRIARHIAQQVIQNPLPGHVLLNVNIPNLPDAELKGMRPTFMAPSHFAEKYVKRTDPAGKDYYWLGGAMELLTSEPDADAHALAEGYVSLTPLSLDLTHREGLAHLRTWSHDAV